MLQDMRHLIIIDMREVAAFEESHIRRSINANLENFKDQILGAMLLTKDDRYRSHYPADDLKRVLFILPLEDSNRIS